MVPAAIPFAVAAAFFPAASIVGLQTWQALIPADRCPGVLFTIKGNVDLVGTPTTPGPDGAG
jgi:hypothetical protein